MIGVLALVVVIGVAAAARSFLHSGNTPKPSASIGAHPSSGTSSAATDLSPVSAQGFDALNLSDTGDENTNQAMNVINHQGQGWSSQQYATSALGSLKAGTGLILDMGHTVRLSSVTIQLPDQHRCRRPAQAGQLRRQEQGQPGLDGHRGLEERHRRHRHLPGDQQGHRPVPGHLVHQDAACRRGQVYMAQVFSVSARGTVVSG